LQAEKLLKTDAYFVETKLDGDRILVHYKDGADPPIRVRS
jgi:ATP-dependent DNA ligase